MSANRAHKSDSYYLSRAERFALYHRMLLDAIQAGRGDESYWLTKTLVYLTTEVSAP